MEKGKGETVVFSLSYMQIIIISLAGALVIVFSFLLGMNIGGRSAAAVAAPTLEADVPPPPPLTTAPEATSSLTSETVTITSLQEETPPLTFNTSLTDTKPVPAPLEREPVANKPKEKSTHTEKVAAKQTRHEEKKATHKPAKPAKHEKFALQVASLSSKAAAVKFSKEFSAKGYLSYLEEADLKGKGVWYRVYVGGFATRAEAEAAKAKIKAKNSIIVER